MCVGVDQAGQNRCLAQIDNLSSGWNFDLCFGADLRDALTLKYHNLTREHLTVFAVEQPTGTHGDRSCRWSALNNTAIRADARCRACAAPRSRRWLNLCKKRDRNQREE